MQILYKNYIYSMEQNEDQLIRLQICEKCYEHASYDNHSQKQYQQAYQQFTKYTKQIGLKILKNVPPKYLQKTSNTKMSTKRYIDCNNSKIVEFPSKGSFQVYYKNILVFSKNQIATLPDVKFMCQILKAVRDIYRVNPVILSSLNRFRDIQYQWKKNITLSQSLYHYIKLNACGNDSQECIVQILRNLMTKHLQETKNAKKKQVYPYSIFIGKEKKFRMQSIYCPRPITARLSGRPMSSTFGLRTIAQTKKQLKDPILTTDDIQKTSSNYWTNRQSGKIVRTNKNHIFQMVLKQQNKILDQQKLKKWRNQSNLAIQTEQRKYNMSSRDKSLSKNDRKILKRRNKQNKQDQNNQGMRKYKNRAKNKSQGKQIFVTFLNNLRNNNKTISIDSKNNAKNNNNNSQKLKINFKKSALKTNKQQTNRRQSISNTGKNSNKSSLKQKQKSASINKNDSSQNKINDTAGLQQKNKNSRHASYRSDNQIVKIGKGEGSNMSNYKSQRKASKSKISSSGKQSIDHFPTTSKQKRNSKCLRQSQYMKMSKSLQKSLVNKIDQNQPTQQQKININQCKKQETPVQTQNTQIQKINQQHLNNYAIKRLSIEEATVKKRISQRKRSSFHERHLRKSNIQNNTLDLQTERQSLFQPQSQPPKISQCLENTGQQQDIVVDYEKFWTGYQSNFMALREPAPVIRKFVNQANFTFYSSYNEQYNQIIKSPNSPEVQFTIKGEQLVNIFVTKSIQSLCKPSQIRLFPQIFKQIQYTSMNQTSTISTKTAQNESLKYSRTRPQPNSHYYKSKLIHVVNLMIRSNPMTISRIFQDKKMINPFGVYCVWLKNMEGCYRPVFVNDVFAFQEVSAGKQNCRSWLRPVYSWLSHQNSMWFMLLEKAVAKVLGGYHVINQLSISQLMSIIMGAPTVDIGSLNPQKALKIFDQKLFFNKMITIHALRQNHFSKDYSNQSKSRNRVDRIVGFSYNRRNPKQSSIQIKVQQSTVAVSLQEFILNYSEIALLFFNNNYFMNQSLLQTQINCKEVISCRLICRHSKNNCYLIFSCFPQKQPTKVTIYRQLTNQQSQIKQGMNPLSEQRRRYQYVGEISKTGNFFFQLQINGGQYICLMQNQYEKPPFISIYSQFPIQIGEICNNQLRNKQKNSQIKSRSRHKKNRPDNKTWKNLQSKNIAQGQPSSIKQTPKILIQQKISPNKFKQQQQQQKQFNKSKISELIKSKAQKLKIKKQFLYDLDNLDNFDDSYGDGHDKCKDKDKGKYKGKDKQNKNNSFKKQTQVSINMKKKKKQQNVIFDALH